MKRFFLCCIAVVFAFAAHAQDRQDIVKLMRDQEIAWNKGDIDGFMQGYWKSDSLVFVGKTAPVYGWQGTIDRYKKTYPDKATMGELKFTLTKVEVLDPHNAFVLGAWHLKRDKGDIGGYYTLWFKKINGKWKIVCDHTS